MIFSGKMEIETFFLNSPRMIYVHNTANKLLFKNWLKLIATIEKITCFSLFLTTTVCFNNFRFLGFLMSFELYGIPL